MKVKRVWMFIISIIGGAAHSQQYESKNEEYKYNRLTELMKSQVIKYDQETSKFVIKDEFLKRLEDEGILDQLNSVGPSECYGK